METHSTEIRVRYKETDQMGVVYHSNYLVWMEVGRVELLRSRGHTYKQMEQDGFFLPVKEVHVKYRQSAKFDDIIVVETVIEEYRKASLKIGYRMYRKEDGNEIADGYTIHPFIDQKGKILRFNERLKAYFQKSLSPEP
jgi:acyl-CoA thioester hydrolase